MAKNLREARYFRVTGTGMAASVPFLVFAFMYQPNIPMIYREMKEQTYPNMRKVVGGATAIVVTAYIIASTFGYLGLVNYSGLSTLMDTSNILEVDYKNWAFTIGVIVLLFTVFSAAPLVILPAKDDFEAIVFKANGMNTKWNIIVTIGMCLTCYILAVAVPTISDIITILGNTTNPVSGFLLPVIFYLRIIKRDNQPKWKYYGKLVSCILILIFVTIVSIMGLVLFVIEKVTE